MLQLVQPVMFMQLAKQLTAHRVNIANGLVKLATGYVPYAMLALGVMDYREEAA